MICWLIYLPFILVGLGAFIYLVICNKNEWHERNNIFLKKYKLNNFYSLLIASIAVAIVPFGITASLKIGCFDVELIKLIEQIHVLESILKNKRTVNIDGEYFYLTTPSDISQRLFVEKKTGKEEYEEAYMFIGYIKIQNNKIIKAHRDFIVRVENEKNQLKPEITAVDWNINHMLSDPNDSNIVAYVLSTQSKKNLASNEAFFIGTQESDEKIIGKMHYMMRDSDKWLIADKTLERKKSNANRNENPFINCEKIKEWLNKHDPKKVNLTCLPLNS